MPRDDTMTEALNAAQLEVAKNGLGVSKQCVYMFLTGHVDAKDIVTSLAINVSQQTVCVCASLPGTHNSTETSALFTSPLSPHELSIEPSVV